MSAVANLPRRIALLLVLSGLAVLAVGALLQSRGVAVPALLWATTAFGVAARLGGVLALCGLGVFAWEQLLADPRRDARFARVGADLPQAVVRRRLPQQMPQRAGDLPAVTAQQVAHWQRRFAEGGHELSEDDAGLPERRLGYGLHRAGLAVVTGALACLLVLAALGQGHGDIGLPPAAGAAVPGASLPDAALPGAAVAGGQAALTLLGLTIAVMLAGLALLALWRRWRRAGRSTRQRLRALAAQG